MKEEPQTGTDETRIKLRLRDSQSLAGNVRSASYLCFLGGWTLRINVEVGMLRTSLASGFLALCVGGSWAVAQDGGLPAPPKPPKSKAKEAEKAGENVPPDPTPSP